MSRLSVLLILVFISIPAISLAAPHPSHHQHTPAVFDDIFSPSFSTPQSPLEYDIFVRHDMTRPEGPRHFYLYSPSSYSTHNGSMSYPLVLFFHGVSDTCEQYITQFSVYAFVGEVHQYHVGIMCGTLSSSNVVAWNAGMCCLGQNSSSIYVDDIIYTRTAVSMINSLVNVDNQRIYAMGHSNGAFMSEALACNASDIFSAIASNAGGTVLVPGNEAGIAVCDRMYGENSTSILLIHGTGDTSVPYDGNPNSGLPSVKRDFSAWSSRNDCSGSPVQTLNQGVATNLVYQKCRRGTQVELTTIDKGVHMWYVNSDFRSSDYTLTFFDRVYRSKQRK